MRIVYIAAGAGGMYCGACARDVTLVSGLTARGHEVQVIPLYTPLRIDSGEVPPSSPIFYGGINVYLQNISPVFSRLPAGVTRWLDSPALLKWVSGFAIRTSPKDLGPMTVSVLSGRDGHQGRELQNLIDYLEREARPELVSITNSLLSGIAPEIKRRLGVPVVCTLQGEDSFVEAIPEPHGAEAQKWMRKNASSIDMFIAPGERYAARMAGFLGVPRESIRVVRAGVDVETYAPAPERAAGPFTIGYLSAVNHSKGLDLLVDAFSLLASENGRDVRLRVAGRAPKPDYMESVKKRLRGNGLEDRFEYLGEIDFTRKLEFFRDISVFCLPSRIAESRGMAVMEAMASGVAAIVPNTGVFPEMIGHTGGGLLFASGDVNALANALTQAMDSPGQTEAMGRAAREGIARHYSAGQMVDETVRAYEQILNPLPEAHPETAPIQA